MQLIARELRGLGYSLPGAQSLKTKHIGALVSSWKAAGLSAGTLRTAWPGCAGGGRRCASRACCPATYRAGIERRSTWKGQKAHATPADKLAALPERAALALRLQMAFGLRLEESLKFPPGRGRQGRRLTLQASWCKGGRSREIPIRHPKQRALLNELRTLVGDGSLVQEGQSYISARKELERVTWALACATCTGHRHWYAQWRYQTLTAHRPRRRAARR